MAKKNKGFDKLMSLKLDKKFDRKKYDKSLVKTSGAKANTL
jgi:hypothetical protein